MKRRTKVEVLAEFHRLYDVFDAAMDAECAIFPEMTKHRAFVHSRETMLGWVAEGKSTASEILSGVRQALDDYFEKYEFDRPDRDPAGAGFLLIYRAKTGRDFFDDAGRPGAHAKIILKRGKIIGEREFRLLNAICSQVGQTLLTTAQIARAGKLLRDFDESLGK